MSALRTQISAPAEAHAWPFVATGSSVADARLGGGLARGALHELYAEEGHHAGAAGFALLVSLCGDAAKPLIWVREDKGERGDGRLHAPGLAELGADPARIILVTGRDALSVLRAAAEIVGCGAVGAVVIEPWGKAPALDLTASRRLALAAARSGVLTLVLRAGATPSPSAATTRWRVGAAPSGPLAANAPGRPTFDISLLRHRSGIAGFDARVEWDRDARSFRDAAPHRVDVGTPLPGRVFAPAAVRTVAEFGRRAA
ncbi:ImuA family protein [Glacieibacterium frigidum]|uniref:Protein ImuA n=1 Tax=Glacieibacterium frigidum TaxID=2593303 RepID=A0A552UEN7_9SPHN|nr:hypothetical protein [Glacieibacterium frigidum]TRW16672.1 hypothetical protein FMM06_00170 [Glacieibacterium frigidum]